MGGGKAPVTWGPGLTPAEPEPEWSGEPQGTPWLLVLHWPVRCRRCSKRQFVFLMYARQIIVASPPQNQEQLAQDSWQNFTTSESPALRSDQHSTDNEGVR